MQQVGVVQQVFRYPVKSMLGESLNEFEIGPNGVIGDRAWAIRETSGRIATAKKFANLLDFQAAYESRPQPDLSAPVRIIMPDGRSLHAADHDASQILSTAFGRPVTLQQYRPDERSHGEIDPQTIFGDVGVERVMPGLTTATMPDSFALLKGAFFDSATIHFLTTGSMAHLRSLIGEDAKIDARRFRPNIVIDTGARSNGFVEDEWLDGVLQIGERTRIVSMQKALRCVMTTHRQSDLPRDLRVLRATAQHHAAKLGVFASIGAPGVVRIGDPVWLTN
jgi:uncharacterized protein YcbX